MYQQTRVLIKDTMTAEWGHTSLTGIPLMSEDCPRCRGKFPMLRNVSDTTHRQNGR